MIDRPLRCGVASVGLMKTATFPHMGMVYVPMQVLMGQLGIPMVVPPPSSARTLALASRHSPETVCIPYKLVLGNFMEAMELGANVLILLAGPNNCRFGYYSILQRRGLPDPGYLFWLLLPHMKTPHA